MASFSELEILPKELRNLVYEKISPKDLVAAIRSGQIQDLTLQQWYKIHKINFNAQDSYEQFLTDLKLAKVNFQTFEQFYNLNKDDADVKKYAQEQLALILEESDPEVGEKELNAKIRQLYNPDLEKKVPYYLEKLEAQAMEMVVRDIRERKVNIKLLELARQRFDNIITLQDVPEDFIEGNRRRVEFLMRREENEKREGPYKELYLRQKYKLLEEQKITNVDNFTLLHNLSPGFYLDTKGNSELKDITPFDVYFDITQANKLSFYDYYGKIDVILDDIKITLISDDQDNIIYYHDWLKTHAKYFKCINLSLDTRHTSDSYVPFPYRLSERPVDLKSIRVSDDMALFEIFAGESENYYTKTRLRPLTEADMFYTEDKKQIRKLQGVEEITLRGFQDHYDEPLDVIGKNLILILKFNKIKKFTVEDFDAYPEEWWEMLVPKLEQDGTTIEFNFWI